MATAATREVRRRRSTALAMCPPPTARRRRRRDWGGSARWGRARLRARAEIDTTTALTRCTGAASTNVTCWPKTSSPADQGMSLVPGGDGGEPALDRQRPFEPGRRFVARVGNGHAARSGLAVAVHRGGRLHLEVGQSVALQPQTAGNECRLHSSQCGELALRHELAHRTLDLPFAVALQPVLTDDRVIDFDAPTGLHRVDVDAR